jgi:hypothetical protein
MMLYGNSVWLFYDETVLVGLGPKGFPGLNEDLSVLSSVIVTCENCTISCKSKTISYSSFLSSLFETTNETD